MLYFINLSDDSDIRELEKNGNSFRTESLEEEHLVSVCLPILWALPATAA